MLTLIGIDTDRELSFTDVQFSVVNTNYVLALTSDSRFFVVSLSKDTRLDFSELKLDLSPPHSPYRQP